MISMYWGTISKLGTSITLYYFENGVQSGIVDVVFYVWASMQRFTRVVVTS